MCTHELRKTSKYSHCAISHRIAVSVIAPFFQSPIQVLPRAGIHHHHCDYFIETPLLSVISQDIDNGIFQDY